MIRKPLTLAAAGVLFASSAMSSSAIAATSVPNSGNGYPFFAVTTCGTVDFSDAVASSAYRPGTIDKNGNLCTATVGGATGPDQSGTNASDGQAASASNQHALAFNYIFNGTSWDRARGTNGSAFVVQPDVRMTSVSLSAATNSVLDIPLNGSAVVGLKFVGLAASGATITYYSSNDATATPASPINSLNASLGQTSGTRTTDGETRVAVSGRATLRLQVTTGGTGTITVSYNVSVRPGIVDLGSPIPPGSNLIGSVTDPNNAPYGASGATQCTALTPGGSAVTACRAIKISCPSTNAPAASATPVAGQGYANLTLANGQTVRQPIANGGDYGVQALQVTQVGNQVTESGTLATCVFQNVN